MKHLFFNGWKFFEFFLKALRIRRELLGFKIYPSGLNFPVQLFRLPPEDETPAKAEVQIKPEILNTTGIIFFPGGQNFRKRRNLFIPIQFEFFCALVLYSPRRQNSLEEGNSNRTKKLKLNRCKSISKLKRDRHKKTLLSILIVTLSLCYGCLSPPVNPKAKPILIDKATLELSSDGKTLQGTGRVLFDQPLFGLYSKELYFVKAEFLHPYSSLIIHSHLSDFSKQDGVRVLLHRESNDLSLYISTPGYRTQKLSTESDYFLGNQRVALYIEIENGTKNLVDVAVWNFYINPRGNLKTPSLLFSRQNQFTFSNNPLFYSKGQGIL